ncbi:MAG: CRISPR-associated protein Cas4 [Proteobacteria bacterium]|jgi:CRISPR-associated exonuclease Cas4|nr:CRISPR-associated protein Cas4 [Pseudomonadota bacterium]
METNAVALDAGETGEALPVDSFLQGPDRLEVPISALEHFSYCPRQCALIHVEQTFEDNLYTAMGTIAHSRVDSGDASHARGVRVVRGIDLWSDRLGLRGKADAVEFVGDRATGTEVPVPVEYKIGRKVHRHALFQLCAQALCLEEMLGTAVPRGVIWSVGARRRTEVALDAELRRETEDMVEKVRTLLSGVRLPPAINDARCPKCSLVHACLPAVVASPARIRGLASSLYRPLAGPVGAGTVDASDEDDTILTVLPAWGAMVEDDDDGG